jgi:hypothetical protein
VRSLQPLLFRDRSPQPASTLQRLEHPAQTLILDREAVTELRSCEHHAAGQIVQHSLIETVSQAQEPLDDRPGPQRRSIDGISRPRQWQRSIVASGSGSFVPAAQGITRAEFDAYARFPGGPVLADRSVPSQLLMGNGNGPVARVFTRQSAAQLRPYQFEPISKEPGAR